MFRRDFIQILKSISVIFAVLPYRGFARSLNAQMRSEYFTQLSKALSDQINLDKALITSVLKSIDAQHSSEQVDHLLKNYHTFSKTNSDIITIKKLYSDSNFKKICQDVLIYLYGDLNTMKEWSNQEKANAYTQSAIWNAINVNPKGIPTSPNVWASTDASIEKFHAKG